MNHPAILSMSRSERWPTREPLSAATQRRARSTLPSRNPWFVAKSHVRNPSASDLFASNRWKVVSTPIKRANVSLRYTLSRRSA